LIKSLILILFLLLQNAPAYSACDDVAQPSVNWAGCDLSGINLSHKDLSNAVFTSAKLDDAVLTGAILEKADFNFASLKNADFDDARMIDARLVAVKAQGAARCWKMQISPG
jgi:uncharacterized protein YjbI with pentapeptide repeats